MPPTPIAVLDSNEYIHGISTPQSASGLLLGALMEAGAACRYRIATPKMVQLEVAANLRAIDETYPQMFFYIANSVPWQGVDYTEPSDELVLKYLALGLSEEDAAIGAFTEAIGAKHLVSENRHFLEELRSDAFTVVDAAEFLRMLASK